MIVSYLTSLPDRDKKKNKGAGADKDVMYRPDILQSQGRRQL